MDIRLCESRTEEHKRIRKLELRGDRANAARLTAYYYRRDKWLEELQYYPAGSMLLEEQAI